MCIARGTVTPKDLNGVKPSIAQSALIRQPLVHARHAEIPGANGAKRPCRNIVPSKLSKNNSKINNTQIPVREYFVWFGAVILKLGFNFFRFFLALFQEIPHALFRSYRWNKRTESS